MTVKEEPDERVLLIEELDSSPVSAAQISHCTDRDPTLAHVRDYLTRGWPDGKMDMNMTPYHCRSEHALYKTWLPRDLLAESHNTRLFLFAERETSKY